MWVIDKHPIVRLEYFPYHEQKPLFGEATHIQAGFAHERHLQLLLQVLLFVGNLLHGVSHQMVSSDTVVKTRCGHHLLKVNLFNFSCYFLHFSRVATGV